MTFCAVESHGVGAGGLPLRREAEPGSLYCAAHRDVRADGSTASGVVPCRDAAGDRGCESARENGASE